MSDAEEFHKNLEALTAQYEKRIYDLQQFLEISRSLCSTLDFSNLIQSILFISMSQVHCTGAGIFILDALESDIFRLYTNSEIRAKKYSVHDLAPLMRLLNSEKKCLTVEEILAVAPDIGSIDGIAELHASLIVPLKQHGRLNGVLVLGERIDLGDGVRYTDYEKEQMVTIASLSAVAIFNSILVERSSTDMMTHLKLKYYFFNILTEKLDEAVTRRQNLAVIMFDIDFFKKFNDTYGHACGDYVLQSVAKIIKSCVREQDLASRYGGEEFVVMLANTAKAEALAVAERIRFTVESSRLEYEGQSMRVTISCGVSVYDSTGNSVRSPKEFVDQADKALYISKRNGRNRVTFATKGIIESTQE